MSQGRSFLSNLSFTLALNLFIKLFWVFGIEIAVQNVLGTESYGRYFEAFNFAYIFFILLDLGISNYNSRTVAGDQSKIQQLFPVMLSMKLLLSCLYLIVLYLAARLLQYDNEHRYLILFVGLNQVFISMLLYLRSNIAALHLFRLDGLLSVLDRLLMGLLCATLLWLPSLLGSLSLKSFVMAQFVGYALAVILALIAVLKQGVPLRLSWKPDEVQRILKGALPFALLFFLMSLYTRIDSVMLGRLLPDGSFQAGLYASAFRILDAALIFTVLLSNILLPMFSRMLANKEPVKELVAQSYRIVLVALGIFCLASFFYAEDLYGLMYRENLSEGSRLFALLMLNFCPMALGYIFGTLLTANGDMRMLNLVSLLGLAVNIVINALLIPIYGAFGAVAATLGTQGLVTLINFLLCLKKFKLPIYDFIHWKVMVYMLGSALLFGLPKFLDLDFPATVLLLTGVILSLLLSIGMGLIDYREIKALVKVKASSSSNDSKA